MSGIVGFGSYVPYNRLKRKELKEVWGGWVSGGEKAVANYDEDSVSMAVQAALNCVESIDVKTLDGLFIATTTSPYDEKQVATTVAQSIDMRDDVRTGDFTESMRAGSTAFLSAWDAVNSNSSKILVTMSDCRLGASTSQLEENLGDGAAAFVIGKENVLAEIEATNSVSYEFLDYWRSAGDKFIRSWEERFIVSQGYAKVVPAAVEGFMKHAGLKSKDISKLILNSPSPRYQQGLAQGMGFNQEQIQDNLHDRVGNAGTANAPMMLIGALEEAKAGDRIIMVTFGEGCDLILLKVSEAIEKFSPSKTLLHYINSKRDTMDYGKYMRWRNLISIEPPRRPERMRPSLPALWRNYKQNITLYGTRCTSCGTPQYPMQRVCIQCQEKDKMEEYKFADKNAVITTYTIDHLAASPDPPTIIAVIDFEEGGRIISEMTDADPSRVGIGMEVEMSFRRLFEAGGIHNYSWKAQLKR